jgi:hypothetical protein
MMRLRFLKDALKRFRHDERGVVTVEFVVVFPVFLLFFMATYENGMISMKHVMLERGVDIAVREIRIGQLSNVDADVLRDRICDIASIIPDCSDQLRVEMITANVRNWDYVDNGVQCIDRSAETQADVDFDAIGNNLLMFLRVCARIDPEMPTSGLLGRSIVAGSAGNAAAAGSYALVSSAAFVVEPFMVEP